jgi:hypothetical protein
MTGQNTNPVFEQWLMAYENHLERVAQGTDRDGDPRESQPASAAANDWPGEHS